MNQPPPGRLHRAVFMVFATLGVFIGLAGAVLLTAYWSVPRWRMSLEPVLGKPDDSLIWQVMVGILIVEGALAVLAWLFSFDTRAARRPRIGMTFILASAGLLGGAVAVAPPALLPEVSALSPPGLAILAAGAAVLPLVWLGIEAVLRAILESLVKRRGETRRTRTALFLGRLLLLFRPGNRDILRALALDRFRRGDRSDAVKHDLKVFFDEGAPSEELVEALCRLAAEDRDPPRYLFYLTQLHVIRPDDEDLTEALIEENLAQGNKAEALRLVQHKGVGDSLAERERHARLLLAAGSVEPAVTIARQISEEEGIPFSVSGDLLRKVLEIEPACFPAMNLLAEQATATRNLERAVRRFEESLDKEPNQPRVKRQLLALCRELHRTEAMERLLEEFVGNADAVEDLALAEEYADVLVANKKLGPARAYLAKLVTHSPAHFPFLDRYAEVLCDGQEWKEAADVNDEAAKLAEREEDKARCRSRSARIERALLTAEVYDLRQEVEGNPGNVDLALQLVRRFVEMDQVERAIDQADKLLHRVDDARPQVKETLRDIGLKPEGPFVLLSFLADLHLEDREYDAAIELIEPLRIRSLTPDAVENDLCHRILQRVPNHLEALRRMGEISQREHRFADMVHFFVLYSVHGGETTDEINHSLFEAYENLNDYKNARVYGERLIEAHPDSDAIAVRLAQLAFKSSYYDEALQFAGIARDRNPETFETQRLISRIDRIRRETLSVELQQKLDRGDADAQDIETLADLYRSLEFPDKAIPLYQRSARDPERAVRCKAKLALSLAEKGLFDLADETITGIEVAPDAEETPLILDLLYQVAGQFESERMVERAGRVYKTVFLIDAGYRDVVKKVEKYA